MKKEQQVTPWKAQGTIDYELLIKEFGIEKISDKTLARIKKHTKELHFMLRRKVFFAGRDLDFLLDEYEKGNKFFLYTGRAPSGNTTLGHLLPWMLTKWLQDVFDVELWFQLDDEEKVLFKKEITFADTEKFLYENMLDIIALGFDPKKTHFLIDTKHANLMYKPACEVAKKLTYSMIKSTFGFDDQANVGMIFYTAMQAVPAFLPSIIKGKNIPCLIPHAVDQDPHFRLTRDVLPKLGYYKPASIQCSFLPPLSGVEGKMGSSQGAAIYTTDDEKEVERKIKKYAFSGGKDTLEEHRRHGGNPDVDVSFQYLKYMFEPDDSKLKKIYSDYKSGAMTSGEIKQIAIDKINAFLKEHQKKRKSAKSKIDSFMYHMK